MTDTSEKDTYTDSAKIDYCIKYIEKNKHLDKIIYKSSLTTQPLTILINPLDDTQLTNFCNDNPEEFPTLFKAAIITHIAVYRDKKHVELCKKFITVKLTLDNEIKLSDWTPEHEGIVMSSRCQVIMLYKEESYTKYVRYFCPKCDYDEEYALDPQREDAVCKNDKCERHDKMMSRDFSSVKSGRIRKIVIQELMEEAKHGSPRILDAEIRDDDVATTFLGQRKKLVGVFRSIPQKYRQTNNIMIKVLSMFDMTDTDKMMPTEQQLAKFMALAKDKKQYLEILTRSWSPQIYGEKLAKTCMILSRVGGLKVDNMRGLIHLLLIGNPAMAKTKILEFLELVTQRAAFATGGSSSGSGITVLLDKLPNGTKIPRAGIVPLCSGSHVALDEISQFEQYDHDKLYECMETGKIHFRKGGFDHTLDADTSIKAGANPKGYEYNTDFGMVDNIKLPKPLISRFDLIVNMLHTGSIIDEEKVVDHMILVRQIGIDEYVKRNNLLTKEELLVLFNHCESLTPTMPTKTSKLLKDFHLTMLGMEFDETQKKGSRRIDRRFFESMYRVATAIAKLFFSDVVTEEHAVLAIEIYKQTLETFGLTTDKGVRQLSMTSAAEDTDSAFEFTFKKLSQAKDTTLLPEHEVIDAMVKDFPQHWHTKAKAASFFHKQHKEGVIEYHEGFYKLTGS